MSSRPAWVTKQDPVSKRKKKGRKRGRKQKSVLSSFLFILKVTSYSKMATGDPSIRSTF
jgi:hypothetical protein